MEKASVERPFLKRGAACCTSPPVHFIGEGSIQISGKVMPPVFSSVSSQNQRGR